MGQWNYKMNCMGNLLHSCDTRTRQLQKKYSSSRRTRRIIITNTKAAHILNLINQSNGESTEKGFQSFHGSWVTQEPTLYAVTVLRQVPFSRRKETERELQRIECNRVISRVEDPTEWSVPMVVIPKIGGKVWVYVHFTKLSQIVQRENHPLPPTDATFANFLGALYSSLDANSGFWQIKPSQRSNLWQVTTLLIIVCSTSRACNSLGRSWDQMA